MQKSIDQPISSQKSNAKTPPMRFVHPRSRLLKSVTPIEENSVSKEIKAKEVTPTEAQISSTSLSSFGNTDPSCTIETVTPISFAEAQPTLTQLDSLMSSSVGKETFDSSKALLTAEKANIILSQQDLKKSTSPLIRSSKFNGASTPTINLKESPFNEQPLPPLPGVDVINEINESLQHMVTSHSSLGDEAKVTNSPSTSKQQEVTTPDVSPCACDAQLNIRSRSRPKRNIKVSKKYEGYVMSDESFVRCCEERDQSNTKSNKNESDKDRCNVDDGKVTAKRKELRYKRHCHWYTKVPVKRKLTHLSPVKIPPSKVPRTETENNNNDITSTINQSPSSVVTPEDITVIPETPLPVCPRQRGNALSRLLDRSVGLVLTTSRREKLPLPTIKTGSKRPTILQIPVGSNTVSLKSRPEMEKLPYTTTLGLKQNETLSEMGDIENNKNLKQLPQVCEPVVSKSLGIKNNSAGIVFDENNNNQPIKPADKQTHNRNGITKYRAVACLFDSMSPQFSLGDLYQLKRSTRTGCCYKKKAISKISPVNNSNIEASSSSSQICRKSLSPFFDSKTTTAFDKVAVDSFLMAISSLTANNDFLVPVLDSFEVLLDKAINRHLKLIV